MVIVRNMSRNATNSEENGLRNIQFIFTKGQCSFVGEGGVTVPVVAEIGKRHVQSSMIPFGTLETGMTRGCKQYIICSLKKLPYYVGLQW